MHARYVDSRGVKPWQMSLQRRGVLMHAAFKVVEHAEMNTNRGAAAKYSVNEKQVSQWRMKKEELKDLPKKKRRMEGGGCRNSRLQ